MHARVSFLFWVFKALRCFHFQKKQTKTLALKLKIMSVVYYPETRKIKKATLCPNGCFLEETVCNVKISRGARPYDCYCGWGEAWLEKRKLKMEARRKGQNDPSKTNQE